jgi:GT2 family glycosyltransferase
MISLLITNYNTWPLTLKCIEASFAQVDTALIKEIIVIDDGSRQEAPEILLTNHKVKIHYNSENLGYAACVNKAFALANEDICLLLDSDAYIISGLTVIIKRFQQKENLGILSLKLVDENGNITGSAEPEVNFWSILLGQQLDARFGSFFYKPSNKWSIFSCAMAVRKIAFEEVNGFDTDFDFLDADHDFSMKINRSPWKIEFENACLVYHIGNGSPQKTSKRVIRFYQNRYKLLKKYNKIKSPRLLVNLIFCRLSLELFILKIKSFFNFNEMIIDKIYGRKQVLQFLKNIHE